MLSLLLAVTFTAGSAAPGRFHGCGMEATQGAPPMAAMAGHHSHDPTDEPAPAPRPGDCQCVGMSCSAAAPSLPTTTVQVVPVVVALGVSILPEVQVRPYLRPDFTLHLAQPPPSQA